MDVTANDDDFKLQENKITKIACLEYGQWWFFLTHSITNQFFVYVHA